MASDGPIPNGKVFLGQVRVRNKIRFQTCRYGEVDALFRGVVTNCHDVINFRALVGAILRVSFWRLCKAADLELFVRAGESGLNHFCAGESRLSEIGDWVGGKLLDLGRALLAAGTLCEPAVTGFVHFTEFSWRGNLAGGLLTQAMQRNARICSGLRFRDGRSKK